MDNQASGWKVVYDNDQNKAQFHIEKGTAFLTPIYNIDKLCTEMSNKVPDFWLAISQWRVSVNGRYGGHFNSLEAAQASAQQSMETMTKKRAVR